VLHQLEVRQAQPLQRRERQLHLNLDSENAGHTKLSPCLKCALQQRGLAYARLSMHHQDAAAPGAATVQQPVNHVAFTFPAEQTAPRQLNARRCPAYLVPSGLGIDLRGRAARGDVGSGGSGHLAPSLAPLPVTGYRQIQAISASA
jgi:hypothetical protein